MSRCVLLIYLFKKKKRKEKKNIISATMWPLNNQKI